MAPIRYSLHFEDYSEHLMSRFGKLLQMQSLVDMTLMCSSHTLRVHKAVLAASSAYFQEVLQKQNGEPLIILKMRFSVLKSLVEFMYCGKTQCLEENLDELVSAAQFLKIKGLSKVTKEGLGITNLSELPVFTPPVVINRPPQALIDLQAQDNIPKVPPLQQLTPATSTSQVNPLGRSNMDMVVRLPFNIEDGGSNLVDYGDNPRTIKPRRGRPSARRAGWEGPTGLGRAAERALLRREQDSRKAIHQLKHLQTRHMQDYMDRVTLSQAVNSICGPEASSSHYMNMDSDLMYINQNVPSNVLDSSNPYSKEHAMSSDEMTSSSYMNNTATGITNDSNNSGISSAMSQYVNALKNAGLPTDLPILFESGDGSYINVNEQVLLDMVQSNEIQYEVIEQPNIIEKVADPSEIKSIDDLSKSIERGEMLIGNKNYGSADTFKKGQTQFSPHEDAINSLNAILPDNFESFSEQPNYAVMNSRLQENNSIENEINNDFSCIDGDMQFFTKSMSDDVKKYYEDQQLHDNRVIDEICPSSSNFNMSLLDTKNTELGENGDRQFNSLNVADLRRSEDCYDFNLQLSQTNEDDALDCLISTAKQSEQERNTLNENDLDNPTKINVITSQEQEELMNDLMDINEKLNNSHKAASAVNDDNEKSNIDCSVSDFNVDVGLHTNDSHNIKNIDEEKQCNDLTEAISSSSLQWEEGITENIDKENEDRVLVNSMTVESEFQESVIDLTETTKPKTEVWSDDINNDNSDEKENEDPESNDTKSKEDNIPFALGLLPLKQMQIIGDEGFLKRKSSPDSDISSNRNGKSFKRKPKSKKI